MGEGRKTQTCFPNESITSAVPETTGAYCRNLKKHHLGGVIFGCKNATYTECLFKQLFGLPSQHITYVKNIEPGLPLFLFNYNDRKLHGIFEAASSGQLNINPYAWSNGTDRTQYPAQVQIRVRLQCKALKEEQFKPIIEDNYYRPNHFWFELDHAQSSKLISVLSSLAVAPSPVTHENTAKWRTIVMGLPPRDQREGSQVIESVDLEDNFGFTNKSTGEFGSSEVAHFSDDNNQSQEACISKQMEEKNKKDLIYMKLQELAFSRALSGGREDTLFSIDANFEENSYLEAPPTISEGNNNNTEEVRSNTSDRDSIIHQLMEEIKELKAFKMEQIHKMDLLEHKLAEAVKEITHLKDRYKLSDSMSNYCGEPDGGTSIESFAELHLNLDESIFLVGGYDGISWLSALDCYSPTQDAVKSLKPMSSVRSYASVAKLNGELYVFGGGYGCLWYDTVESYNPKNDQWSSRPPLNDKKGSLGGATLNNKIFAIGGGNGVESFSEVEMFDLDVGRWISTRSMLQKRFALAAAQLDGVVYATGGYDGKDYLRSAERFDPREHSWNKIGNMNTKRGCHSLAVLNGKLYALGGYDGSTMVQSVEYFDPRMGLWTSAEPMNQSRGYSAAAVLNESIYIIGGLKSGDNIVDTVECYKEGQGWQTVNLSRIGTRCFLSAMFLGGD